jgi:hypothetical protein
MLGSASAWVAAVRCQDQGSRVVHPEPRRLISPAHDAGWQPFCCCVMKLEGACKHIRQGTLHHRGHASRHASHTACAPRKALRHGGYTLGCAMHARRRPGMPTARRDSMRCVCGLWRQIICGDAVAASCAPKMVPVLRVLPYSEYVILHLMN